MAGLRIQTTAANLRPLPRQAKRCTELGIRLSMGSVGDCYDSAMMESFFSSLECEVLDRTRFCTRQEAGTAIFVWLEG